MNINKTNNESEFSSLDTREHNDKTNPQTSFWTTFEENESITLWGADELCQTCFQQPGYHYADVDRQLFVCDNCYNQHFSIDLPIPPPVRSK
jgi:hypothetical protein